MTRATGVGIFRPQVVLVLLCLTCLSCGRPQLHEQTHSAQSPPEATSYEFLESVMSSLARAHGGILMIRTMSHQASLVDLMTANQNGALEIRRAANEMRPYSKALNKNRRDAVEHMLTAYEWIGVSLATQLHGYERIDSAQV